MKIVRGEKNLVHTFSQSHFIELNDRSKKQIQLNHETMFLSVLPQLKSLEIHWCVWDNISNCSPYNTMFILHSIYVTFHQFFVSWHLCSFGTTSATSSVKAITGVFIFVFTRCLLLYNLHCTMRVIFTLFVYVCVCMLFVHWRMNQSVVICSFVRVFEIQHRPMSCIRLSERFVCIIYLKFLLVWTMTVWVDDKNVCVLLLYLGYEIRRERMKRKRGEERNRRMYFFV